MLLLVPPTSPGTGPSWFVEIMMMNFSLCVSLSLSGHLLLTPSPSHPTAAAPLSSTTNQPPNLCLSLVIAISGPSASSSYTAFYRPRISFILFDCLCGLWSYFGGSSKSRRSGGITQAVICPTFANFRFLAVGQIYLVKVASFLLPFHSLVHCCVSAGAGEDHLISHHHHRCRVFSGAY